MKTTYTKYLVTATILGTLVITGCGGGSSSNTLYRDNFISKTFHVLDESLACLFSNTIDQ